jgi:uncharacterized protein YcnI
MRSHQIVRLTGLLSAAALAVLSGAGIASANVSVSPGDLAPGSTTVLDFAVSDMRADSPTTKVGITLPAGQTFTTLAARPKIGWDTTLVRPDGATTGPVSSVVWTLTDDRFGIAPGAFDVFSLQLGPLPASGSVVFPTAQTYKNQLVDSWTPTVNLRPVGPTAMPPPAPVVTAVPVPAAVAVEEPKPDNRSRVTAGLAIGGVLIAAALLGAPGYLRRSRAEL